LGCPRAVRPRRGIRRPAPAAGMRRRRSQPRPDSRRSAAPAPPGSRRSWGSDRAGRRRCHGPVRPRDGVPAGSSASHPDRRKPSRAGAARRPRPRTSPPARLGRPVACPSRAAVGHGVAAPFPFVARAIAGNLSRSCCSMIACASQASRRTRPELPRTEPARPCSAGGRDASPERDAYTGTKRAESTVSRRSTIAILWRLTVPRQPRYNGARYACCFCEEETRALARRYLPRGSLVYASGRACARGLGLREDADAGIA
jgi:hypothetical protein